MWLALVTALAVGPAPLDGVVTVSPAGDTCLAPADVADAVAVWLGDREVDPRLAIEIDAGADAIGFRLLRDGEIRVERSLSPAPAACADRRAAIGLSLAMALDATVLGSLSPPPDEPTPAEPEPEPEPEPALEPAPPPEPEPIPTVAAEPLAFRLSLAATGLGSFGVTPSAGFGGDLAVELGFVPWLDVVVGGEGIGGLPIELGGGQVATAVAAARAGLCPARSFGRVRPRLCVAIAGGALIASGRDFDDSRSVRLPWVAIEPGGDLDIALVPRLSLRVGARAVAPLIRNNLDVRRPSDAVVEAREAPPIGFAGSLGLVIHLVVPD